MDGDKIMNKLVILGIATILFGILAAAGYRTYATAYTTGLRLESAIQALLDKREGLPAHYAAKAREALPATVTAGDDWDRVVQEAVRGRFGETGTQTAILFLKEHGQSVPPETFHALQQVLVAGQQDFTQTEATITAQKQAYRAVLADAWQGRWLHWAGYPKKFVD